MQLFELRTRYPVKTVTAPRTQRKGRGEPAEHGQSEGLEKDAASGQESACWYKGESLSQKVEGNYRRVRSES